MTSTEVNPSRIPELLSEANRHLKRAEEFRKNDASDDRLVCLKLALAHLEQAFAPVRDAFDRARTLLQEGMREGGPAGSRYYHYAVELGNEKLASLADIRAFEAGYFAARRSEPISDGHRAYIIGYRYGEQVRKES